MDIQEPTHYSLAWGKDSLQSCLSLYSSDQATPARLKTTRDLYRPWTVHVLWGWEVPSDLRSFPILLILHRPTHPSASCQHPVTSSPCVLLLSLYCPCPSPSYYPSVLELQSTLREMTWREVVPW